MQTTQFIDLGQRIACGEYDCLKNCCGEDSLAKIWHLMRSLGLTDMGRLSKMLCGCTVRPTGSSTTGAVAPDSSANCTDDLIKWLCTNKESISTARNIIVGVAAVATPEFAPMAAALGLLTQDMLSVCKADGTPDSSKVSIVDAIMDKMCTMDVAIKSWLQTSLPSAISSVLQNLLNLFSPVMMVLSRCCAVRPVSAANPWPVPVGSNSPTPIPNTTVPQISPPATVAPGTYAPTTGTTVA